MKEVKSEFLELCNSYFSPKSMEMITEALEIASDKLGTLARYDATPMVCHGIGVAKIVFSEIGLGRNSTISALLHDVVRLEMISAEQVGEMFGNECVAILKGLCNISDVDTKVSGEQASNFRDLIVSYATDPRVILIKLADRLEVMRSLAMFPLDKQKKKSWESINLYAQIAHKLGLYSIKSELEDLSLRYLETDTYNIIETRLKDSDESRKELVSGFFLPIQKRFEEMGLKYHVKSRTKSIYSIWNKMRKTGVSFEEVYDLFAIRIIIDCEREQEKSLCWSVYSVITDYYTPNTERMRDWISIPKSNGYESLHTTVVTPSGQWVEVQIRSERMDEVAERGIAAHWRYKGVNKGGMGSEEWLSKLRELVEGDLEGSLMNSFNHSLNEIFVFTPDGDLKKLPEGATLLDFAFDIHSNLGASCTGGLINGKAVSIRETLKNGDIVKILTSKNQKPKLDWLNIVITSKAKNRIRAYMREQRAKASNLGREELERKLKNWKLGLSIDEAVTLLCRHFKVKTGTEIYGMIAEEKVDISQVKELLTTLMDNTPGELKTKVVTNKIEASKSSDALIIEEGINDIDYKFAKCCNPIFGDEIFGFVTITTGITIHRTDCPNAKRLEERYPYRVMNAKWRNNMAAGAFRATIKVVAVDSSGIVNAITDTVKELKLGIRSMNLRPVKGNMEGTVDVEVPSTGVLDLVIYSLLKIRGVLKVYRVN